MAIWWKIQTDLKNFIDISDSCLRLFGNKDRVDVTTLKKTEKVAVYRLWWKGQTIGSKSMGALEVRELNPGQFIICFYGLPNDGERVGPQGSYDNPIARYESQDIRKKIDTMLNDVIEEYSRRLNAENILPVIDQTGNQSIQEDSTKVQNPVETELLSQISKIFAERNIKDPTGNMQIIIEMWNQNYTNSEIGQRISVAPKTVTNRISELRSSLGKELLPLDVDRKKAKNLKS